MLGMTMADPFTQLVELTRSGLPIAELFEQAGALLRALVPFDAICWETLDPATLLPTSGVTENLPRESAPAFFRNEYGGGEEFNRFDAMFATGVIVRSLHEATDGNPARSARYRELLVPNGFGPELRALLTDAGECWGALALLRHNDQPEFSGPEVTTIVRCAGHLGWGIRTGLVLAAPVERDVGGPGVVIVDASGEIVSATAAAERWLSLLDDVRHAAGRRHVPVAVEAVLARLSATDEPPRARVRASDGTWLVVHASLLRGKSDDQRAVVIEPVTPRELANVIVRAYALSPRERQVAELVLRGMATKEISQALELSTHTVTDYLKTLFEKVGVHSRGELAARFFFDHHLPRMFGGARVSPGGWFDEN
jgi:DNA-binding CsgD family transcriptional regulator